MEDAVTETFVAGYGVCSEGKPPVGHEITEALAESGQPQDAISAQDPASNVTLKPGGPSFCQVGPSSPALTRGGGTQKVATPFFP